MTLQVNAKSGLYLRIRPDLTAAPLGVLSHRDTVELVLNEKGEPFFDNGFVQVKVIIAESGYTTGWAMRQFLKTEFLTPKQRAERWLSSPTDVSMKEARESLAREFSEVMEQADAMWRPKAGDAGKKEAEARLSRELDMLFFLAYIASGNITLSLMERNDLIHWAKNLALSARSILDGYGDPIARERIEKAIIKPIPRENITCEAGDPCVLCGLPVPPHPWLYVCSKHEQGGWCYAEEKLPLNGTKVSHDVG